MMESGTTHEQEEPENAWFWGRLAEYVTLYPWRLICVWLAILGVLAPFAVSLQDRLTPTRKIDGTESAAVDELLAERFHRDVRHGAVLVIAGLRPIHDAGDKDILKDSVKTVRSWQQVLRASSIIDLPRGQMVGTDGTGALITLQIRPGSDAREMEVLLGQLAAEIEHKSTQRHQDLRLFWTGDFFLHADIQQASARGAREGEFIALPLTFLLLVAIFGSLRAAFCPIISAVVVVLVSIGCAGLMSALLPWAPPVLMQNVISLIGLALTIDYSLLTLNRFRRATENGHPPREAIFAATARSGPTIALAGCSVCLGFAALLVLPIAEIRGIGIGGVLASTMAVLVATTLLPAILGLLAPQVARGRGSAGGAKARAFFATVARSVCRRPVTFLLVSAIPLILLALSLQGLKITAQYESWLPPDAQSTRGAEALVEMGRRGLANEILVVAEVPPDDSFFTAFGWALAHKIYAKIAALDNIDSIIALPRSMSASLKPDTLQSIPRRTIDPLLSSDNRTMLFRIIPNNHLDYSGLERLVGQLRSLHDDGGQVGPEDVAISVGGMPASMVDYVAIVWRWTPYVIAIVIFGAFIVLAAAFRSPVVAIKAVLLNLFSVSAAFGLATLVFIDGHGASLIGIPGPVDGVFPAMPLIVFCAVFGVSMDYEVFLISRIAAARRTEAGETAAIVRGISETGMVITFAAAIMIIVFGSFAAAEFLPAKMLGLTLAVAVFLDATVVRILMSPALMRLAGRWNWWPGR